MGPRSSAKKVETWVWILIYAGLILGGLGLSIARADAALGWIVCASGAVGVLAGVVLIWIRSRIRSH